MTKCGVIATTPAVKIQLPITNMSNFGNVVKEGWHPKTRDGGKESWRSDFKGINQVVCILINGVPSIQLTVTGRMDGQRQRPQQRPFRTCLPTVILSKRPLVVWSSPKTRQIPRCSGAPQRDHARSIWPRRAITAGADLPPERKGAAAAGRMGGTTGRGGSRGAEIYACWAISRQYHRSPN